MSCCRCRSRAACDSKKRRKREGNACFRAPVAGRRSERVAVAPAELRSGLRKPEQAPIQGAVGVHQFDRILDADIRELLLFLTRPLLGGWGGPVALLTKSLPVRIRGEQLLLGAVAIQDVLVDVHGAAHS